MQRIHMTGALRGAFMLSPAGLLASLALGLTGAASVPAAVTIDWATIGNPGNGDDPSTGSIYTPSVGAVSYDYRIGKKEVSNSQYVEFLNAADPTGTNVHALYNSYMSNHPDGVAQTGFMKRGFTGIGQ